MLQSIITYLIVVAAVAYAGYSIYRSVFKRRTGKNPCGCCDGCQGCEVRKSLVVHRK